jgi:hypothetical protein
VKRRRSKDEYHCVWTTTSKFSVLFTDAEMKLHTYLADYLWQSCCDGRHRSASAIEQRASEVNVKARSHVMNH